MAAFLNVSPLYHQNKCNYFITQKRSPSRACVSTILLHIWQMMSTTFIADEVTRDESDDVKDIQSCEGQVRGEQEENGSEKDPDDVKDIQS